MNWRRARLAVVYLYGAAFLAIGLLLMSSAWFGSRPWRFWFYFIWSLPFIAEGIGLLLFLWVARFGLKLVMACAIWWLLALGVEHASALAIFISLCFAALLIIEIWFIRLDREIVAARRAAKLS